jgi:hypothetical protein
MSYARNWAGKVKWRIDNKGVIENFWRMPNCVANNWSRMGDGDVLTLGILVACRMLLRVCGMLNIREGMMSREGKNQSKWTNEEKRTCRSGHVCGRARKMALGDELRWLERGRMSGELGTIIGVRSWRRNMSLPLPKKGNKKPFTDFLFMVEPVRAHRGVDCTYGRPLEVRTCRFLGPA